MACFQGQAVPLPAPPGAAALTTQRVRGATRGNYDNLSNQGPSLPSLWTDQPTFAAANDGNLPAAAPSTFRTVNSAELPATGTTSCHGHGRAHEEGRIVDALRVKS